MIDIYQPTKKIARTLLSNQKASTITFVDDTAWPAIFDATTFSRSRRRNDSSDSDNDGEREPKHVSFLVCTYVMTSCDDGNYFSGILTMRRHWSTCSVPWPFNWFALLRRKFFQTATRDTPSAIKSQWIELWQKGEQSKEENEWRDSYCWHHKQIQWYQHVVGNGHQS